MYKYKFWKIPEDISFLDYRTNEPNLTDSFGHCISTSDYYQGWQSIYQYCFDVLTGKRVAGQHEIAACERFVHDLHREDLVFDKAEVDFCITVCTCLRHPKGPIAGTPFFLMPWMIFIIGQVFGWRYSDKARESLRGEQRFIKSSIFVARGNSKTVLAAALVVIISLITANGSPVLTTSATVQKQSRIAFEDIAKMIKSASPTIKKRFRLLQNEIRVLHNDGKIFPTSSESETLDGLRICGAIIDEVHAHPNSKVVDVLSTGMQSSKDPHMMMISTAGVDTQSYGREIFEYSKEVAKNVQTNDRLLAVVYTVDDEDHDNWHDEATWEKANPALGHAVNLESLRAAYVEATRNEKARANFMTKHLNIFVDFEEESFVNASDLFACRDRSLNDIAKYENKECYLGLDIAGVSDLSSLVYIFPAPDGGIEVFQRSYLPESVLNDVKPSIKDRYLEANKRGELIFTPTEITDIDYIKQDILNAYKDFNVQGLSIDAAAGGTKLSYDFIDEHDIEAVAVKQGYGLSESAILLQSLIKSNKFRYNSDLLEWCFVNALVQEGQSGDIRVIRNKADHSKKIDICIATVIGLSQTILQENQDSIYEHQEVRFL
ncbi:terminase large subunit [Photobacterium damselae]|uniref:terminase large subunit n=1 Tax=Photobacterium damselae TaxID=38293 RepID=UPI00165E2949|nr:terminase TerL endonuclease subunit [Photobacterium damselae]